MMNLQEFLRATSMKKESALIPMQVRRPRIICNSGLSFSMQAGEYLYSTPRLDFQEKYTKVEVGFPSEKIKEIIDYAEDPNEPTESVYGWVDIELLQGVVDANGGINLKATFKTK